MCFVRISEQTAIISLYKRDWFRTCSLRGTNLIFECNPVKSQPSDGSQDSKLLLRASLSALPT